MENMDKIKIIALGGLDEDGRDLYVIEINNDIFVIGGGFKYPNKNTPGIDFIIANYSYLIENKSRVKAFILPKTKKNSFGAIPYIYKEVKAPIYCTYLTKLKLVEFAQHYQQGTDFDFRIVTLPSHFEIAKRFFYLFSTCASMPNTFGFSIDTDLGNIVYSGDFIVEYSNTRYFKLDLNSLGKIAEKPTLILLAESVNSSKVGYCSPNHKLYGTILKYFKSAPGRCFVAVHSDNLYHINEVFQACNDLNKKIYFYDDEIRKVYDLRKIGESDFFNPKNIVSLDDVLRVKDSDLVILIADEGEKVYEKISLLANHENENRQIKLLSNDTFICAAPATDNNEVIATSTIDELYKAGCHVRYITSKQMNKMHAYEEDIKMLLSLLKPRYYFPIEGYYVNLLANAKLAYDMNIGLSHSNIFLLDNGQTLSIDERGAKVDFNKDEKIKVTDVMIDGIGVGDVVNEIISERSRLSEDGVVILACGISKKERKIIAGPDIQMRGFLFLKDKEADNLLKEITRIFVEEVNNWLLSTKNFDNRVIENNIMMKLTRVLLKANNRNPVIRPNILIIE